MNGLPNPISYQIFDGEGLITGRPYTYLMTGQGVWKYAGSRHFNARLLVAPGRIRGLPTLVGPDLALLVPKIPARWLYRVLAHAQQAGRGLRGIIRPIEQMYHFHWFPEEQAWRVAVPKQDATAGHVAYRGGDELTIVLDLHSHHGMKAFFSSTDNHDEQGLRFYGVIGRIYERQPEIRLRLGLYGDFMDIGACELFEHAGPFKDVYEDYGDEDTETIPD